MPDLLGRLDLPDEWNDYPEPAKRDHFEHNIPLGDLTDAVREEYGLPETDREDFPYLKKSEWIALFLELDTTDGETDE